MMQYTLHLTNDNLLKLHAHAEANLPNESAALLFGSISKHLITVNTIELVSNESISSITTFEVNPEEQYRLLIEAEERHEELVCIFHSHPAPPFPSKTDRRNMKLNPVVWLIGSKERGTWESRAYLMNDETVEEVTLILS
ncbi:MAG: Mov34/MPN/PAD-1 family protein [Candidatus Thorarchaeota archaeon]|jgi:proteasome lid subunit RPN8/RPN11